MHSPGLEQTRQLSIAFDQLHGYGQWALVEDVVCLARKNGFQGDEKVAIQLFHEDPNFYVHVKPHEVTGQLFFVVGRNDI